MTTEDATDEPGDRSIVLDANTCRQLLGTGSVGRVALNAQPSPVVLPVNYVFRHDAIMFRTISGTKLTAAEEGRAASFEVDGVDHDRRSGWSILAMGTLDVVPADEPEVTALGEDVQPLVGGDRPHVVRLQVAEMTGRRIPTDSAWYRAHRSHHTWHGQDGSDLLG